MDKKLSAKFNALLDDFAVFAFHKNIPQKYIAIFREFTKSYQQVLQQYNQDPSYYINIYSTFIVLFKEQCQSPYQFELYHHKIRAPFDYYKFSIDFVHPLVDLERSTVKGIEHLDKIEQLLKQKENVIIFANHQSEIDPQAIATLLEHSHSTFNEHLIFIAGTRVTTDPFAIPFSMGCNLLCIHSKKYIHNPPEKQYEKQMHNKRTMQHMVTLLSQGGHAIYVAPSGGRDRANVNGIVEVAPFDPHSIEMLYLMTQKTQTPTHFFPLALFTHHLLPPPPSADIATELGERRITNRGAIHLSFGNLIEMENFPRIKEATDKRKIRKVRANYLWDLVQKLYKEIPKEGQSI